MGNDTILIVDDEFRIRKLLRDYLQKAGYHVVEARNGEEALVCINQNIDLVILDIMLPKLDGWTVCRKIRQQYDLPIIMLTARSDEADEVRGLEMGADEYVSKPFRPQALVARVKALIRRAKPAVSAVLSFNDLVINPMGHEVFLHDRLLELSPKEYDLLLCLARNAGIALSREQILNEVWSYDYYGDLRTVDTHITRLRLKLGAENKYIQTIRGLGYRFEGPA